MSSTVQASLPIKIKLKARAKGDNNSKNYKKNNMLPRF